MESKLKMLGLCLTYQNDMLEPVTVIDFSDFFGNLGMIPLFSLDQEKISIQNIIWSTENEYNQMAQNARLLNDSDSVLLTVCILLKHSMARYKPYKVLEIGGCQGGLSYFLAKTAFMIHKDSQVTCLSELPYEQALLDSFSVLGDEALANLSLLTTSTETNMLQDDYFDFVVINGAELIQNPAAVIVNALRVVRADGRLLCLTQNQYLLDSCFAAYFDEYEEYRLSDTNSLLVKSIGKKEKSIQQQITDDNSYETCKLRLSELHADVGRILKDVNIATVDQLKESVRTLAQMEDIAIRIFAESEDIELKHVFNRAKETVLDYMHVKEPAYKEKCRQMLCLFAHDIQEYRAEILE